MTERNPSPRLTAFDFSGEIRQLTEQFTGREWLYEEIDAWVRQSEQRFFLLTGEPGIGKSAVVAHHFCVVGRNSTVIPGTVLRSLATQLGQVVPDYGLALPNTIKPEFLAVNANIDVAPVIVASRTTGIDIKRAHDSFIRSASHRAKLQCRKRFSPPNIA